MDIPISALAHLTMKHTKQFIRKLDFIPIMSCRHVAATAINELI